MIIARVHGRCVGGGVGLAAAADYAIATENAEVKLSELTIGIGPFVVGSCDRKKDRFGRIQPVGYRCFHVAACRLGKKKGLFAELHPNQENMDESIARLTNELRNANPDALRELKKIFLKGTENWDTLLPERAAISGRLVVSKFTKAALEKLKVKVK